MMADNLPTGKTPSLAELAASLADYVLQAARDGLAAHQAEAGIWKQVLAIGHAALAAFFAALGTGDLGDSFPAANGEPLQRLDRLHSRDYRSAFGDFTLARTCYGCREGQRIDLAPLDTRLQLPQSDYSYLLQEWDQSLACESAFCRVGSTLFDVLGLKQPTDSLQRMNRQMAQSVEAFRQQRPLPGPQEEGEIFVTSGDGKGVVLRKEEGAPPRPAFLAKGQKANTKKMATVAAIYSIDRHARAPEEVVEALFRDGRLPGPKGAQRPEPVGKHVWACLNYHDEEEGIPIRGRDAAFAWLAEELKRRNPNQGKETVAVMDGQEGLWGVKRDMLPRQNITEVLDILHVTPRLWQAAQLFHREGGEGARAFARAQVLEVLRGKVGAVVRRLRQLAARRGLKGNKLKALRAICAYLWNNRGRMRYDEYLRKGYPIASGVIEGACRHYVKDRMERAGMHWTREGAQAMLDVRSEFLNGDWHAFLDFRIQAETARLYPLRQLLGQVPWPLAA